MKRTILVMLISASFMFASAQIQFGVKAGYNLANLTTSPSQSGITSNSDFSAGVLASIPLFTSCSLQPEILYSGQGASFSDSLATGKLNYGYLNVPVLFKYQHSSGLFAETGPQIGFLLSAKEKDGGQSFDAKSSTQSVDFSWAYLDAHLHAGVSYVYDPADQFDNRTRRDGLCKIDPVRRNGHHFFARVTCCCNKSHFIHQVHGRTAE
jgi:hypothetical protein